MLDSRGVRLYRRGKIYWTWYYVPGRSTPIRVSTRCTSERAAAIEARRLEAEAVGGKAERRADPYTIEQALDSLLAVDPCPWKPRTLLSHGSRADAIARHIGRADLAMLSTDRLEDFIEAREEEVSAHETHKELNLLRQALRHARREGHWQGDLESLFPEHAPDYKPRDRWLTRKEAEQLIGAFDGEHHRRWLRFALATGCRWGELEGLDWGDVDLERGLLAVRGTKTEGSDRVLPIKGELRRMLLLTPKAERVGPLVFRWWQAGRDIKAACKRLGIAPCSPNDLRRTCATWMATEGVPAEHIADWLGHKSLDMVRRVYARVNPVALAKAAASVPRLRARQCEKGVQGKSTRNAAPAVSAGTKKAAPPEGNGPSRSWARLESNQRPLASEANGLAPVFTLRKRRRVGGL